MMQPFASFRRVGWSLLAALAVLACDGDGPTGPRVPADPPPADALRLASIHSRIPSDGWQSRNRYTYDAAGRLVRVDFETSLVRNGPLVHTRYVLHEYSGDRLSHSEVYARLEGEFYHVGHAQYEYDALGYLVRFHNESLEDPGEVRGQTTTFRYDAGGRLVEERAGDERTIFRYDPGGTLVEEEKRFGDGTVLRARFQHDAARNPFFRRLGHVTATVLVWQTWPLLLSSGNVLREDRSVGSDPHVVSYTTNEFEYDEAGRPVHQVQTLVNTHDPAAQTTRIFMDYTYEPAGGAQ